MTLSAEPLHAGWYLPAFRTDLPEGLSPLSIGPRRLMAVRTGDTVRVFDASCPHRGAHLAIGGRLDGGCVVCPFHGRRVSLGDMDRPYAVREHRVEQWGDAVFVRLDPPDAEVDDQDRDRGFAPALADWRDSHSLVAALTRPVDNAHPNLIVENAFDADHFRSLHRVPRVEGMQARQGACGELEIEGEFLMLTSPWQDEMAKAEGRWASVAGGAARWNYKARFYARAFSPTVVVTEFGPPDDVHVVVTAATPSDTGCLARVAVGVTPGHEGQLEYLIAGSHKALAEDVSVWSHLDPDHKPRFDARDKPVLAFREFCDTFGRLG